MELPKITLPKIEVKPRLCNQLIILKILSEKEVKIFPDGQMYSKELWSKISSEERVEVKKKPKDRKILTDFSKQDEDEII